MDMISYQMGKNSAPQPSGSLSITENGTYDVTEKASAVVNVQGGQSGLPIEIASSCPSPFLLNQNNLTSNVKYIFPTTTASVVPTSGTTIPFIQSSGTQYIDTGFIPDYNTKVLYKYRFINNNNNTSLGGTDVYDNVSASLNLGNIDDNKIQYRLHYSSLIEQSHDTNIHEVVFNDNGYLIVDNNTLGNFSSRTSYVNSRNLTLFASNSNTGIKNKSSAKLYYLKIYDNGVLVRDFVPAKSQESGHENEVCLYDNVTNAYFYNQGTGTFTYGEDVTPITEIDVGDEVEISLSPVNAYATFSYQWQKLQNDEYVNISSATSSTYTAQTGDNAIRCILTGTGNSEGTITSSSVTVNEVN